VHAQVRSRVAPWERDRIVATDIEALAEMARAGELAGAAAAVCGTLE